MELVAALAARRPYEALPEVAAPAEALVKQVHARKVEDMFDHPQVLAEDMIGALQHPLLGSYRGITCDRAACPPDGPSLAPPGGACQVGSVQSPLPVAADLRGICCSRALSSLAATPTLRPARLATTNFTELPITWAVSDRSRP